MEMTEFKREASYLFGSEENLDFFLGKSALYASMDQYLQGLFILANDPAAEVRKLVCEAFVQLIEVCPSFLEFERALGELHKKEPKIIL
ncbi:hypothetical protein QN277_010454 [Acacia crassicarpa]|uniref:Uncharacterized protein n=2 Tax=Acacia crassicarpa TaxID=499986 RepID=A0AAE1IQW7_9FABA|nr:hypothetical protein QN277_010454 [Acacia crassicarpa]